MTTPIESTISLKEGEECCLHTWNGQAENPKGVALVYHGFAAHGLYATVRYAAELLASSNYIVVAPDLPGHGKSSGLEGYIASAPALIDAAVEIAKHVRETYAGKTSSLFFCGSSMGGAISLLVAQKFAETDATKNAVTGVVLLAPMLMLNVATPARYLLSTLAMLPGLCKMPLIPSNSTSSEAQYRDPEKRKECDNDTLTIKGKLRVGSASACVEMATLAQADFESIQVPFLLMVADEDAVVKNQGSLDLMEKAPATDKTMKRYPALHGLLCEPKPLVDQIQQEMMEWVDSRAAAS
jgi:alpha-beta hydrolase superfamily lysophospholipase